jgi:formylglycine-generating enzyme required for sulfatase activity
MEVIRGMRIAFYFRMRRASSRGLISSRAAKLALAFALLGCGKIPQGTMESATDGGGAVTDGNAASTDSDGLTSDAAGGGFACTSSVQPGDMVSVPAGDFAMGCAPNDTQCREDEKPQHMVTLQAFEIDRTEVTQEQYAACVQAKACGAPVCAWDCTKTAYPAACIDWAQAKAYCAWAGKRLPTEAEWEKAARGTDGRIYPWGNDPPDCAHLNMSSCGEQAVPVGTFPAGASPYGALDMAGNVVEILADWYDPTYYATSPQNEPTGPATGTRYVGRGGGYKSMLVWERASSRDWYDVSDAKEPLGFRCAR